jgi:outer membrane protein
MTAMLILTVLAQAQALTVHQAVDLSLARHPAIAMADANSERGRQLTREARAARRPQLSLESSAAYFEEPMVVAPLHAIDPLNPPVFDRALMQGSVALGYTLFDAARGDRIERAELLASAATVQADAARAQVIAETVRGYLRVQSAAELSLAHEKQVNALRHERERARQLVEQGRGARVVLLRAEAALSAARADAIIADSELEIARQELARLLGMPAERIDAKALTAVRARSEAVATREQLIEAAARRNPELRRLRLQSEAAESERSATRGSWWPRVQLAGKFVEYASSATSPQGEWQGGAQLSYPLYVGGARVAAVDRAAAEVRAARAELALAERRVAEAVDRALTAFNAAQARAVALAAAVSQSDEVTRIERLALDAGAGVQTDYLSAEAALFRARSALTDARASEIFARVELARVTGELTTAWLAAQLENVP